MDAVDQDVGHKAHTVESFDALKYENNLEKSFSFYSNQTTVPKIPKVKPYSQVLNSGTKIPGQKTDKMTMNSKQ